MRTSFVFGGLAVAMVMSASPARAQSVSGGVKGGVSFSTVTNATGELGTGTSLRTGLAAGGFLTVPIVKGVGFQPEVLFSQEGVEISFNAGAATVVAKAKIDYIRVPLLLRVGSLNGSGAYGIVGPVFGSLRSAQQEFPGEPDTDVKSELKSTDWSVVGGVGFDLNAFLIEARYQIGLQDINRTANTSGQTNKGRTLTVLVGVHVGG